MLKGKVDELGERVDRLEEKFYRLEYRIDGDYEEVVGLVMALAC